MLEIPSNYKYANRYKLHNITEIVDLDNKPGMSFIYLVVLQKLHIVPQYKENTIFMSNAYSDFTSVVLIK